MPVTVHGAFSTPGRLSMVPPWPNLSENAASWFNQTQVTVTNRLPAASASDSFYRRSSTRGAQPLEHAKCGWRQDHSAKSHSLRAVRTGKAVGPEGASEQGAPGLPSGTCGSTRSAGHDIRIPLLALGLVSFSEASAQRGCARQQAGRARHTPVADGLPFEI